MGRSGAQVRCLVRDRSSARRLELDGCELRQGDVTDPGSLEGLGSDVDVAYFLVHAMSGGRGFAERERQGALNFARMAGATACGGSCISAGSAK